MKDIFAAVDKKQIKKEREKARELKKTKWWQSKLQAGKCYYCENKFSKTELTMDHLIPLVRGGKSIKNNLATACKKCNFDKKHKTLVEIRLKSVKEAPTNKSK